MKKIKKERKAKKRESMRKKKQNNDERRYKVPQWVKNRKIIHAKLEGSHQIENLGKNQGLYLKEKRTSCKEVCFLPMKGSKPLRVSTKIKPT